MTRARIAEAASAVHRERRPGRWEVSPSKPTATRRDLGLACPPGVAFPCLEAARDPGAAHDLTGRANLVAVIANGTAVRALGRSFGGIGLEDAKAPECFVIEARLKGGVDVPVLHDDRHGAAGIACAEAIRVAERPSGLHEALGRA